MQLRTGETFLIHDGFTSEGLQKLDYYAEQFISGRLVYKRFSPNEQHGCSEGGTTHVIASLLAGAENSTDTSYKEKFCDIRINTPELRAGGVRTLTTEVEVL